MDYSCSSFVLDVSLEPCFCLALKKRVCNLELAVVSSLCWSSAAEAHIAVDHRQQKFLVGHIQCEVVWFVFF